jgi:O-antigen/teichoic acid export membrane protein
MAGLKRAYVAKRIQQRRKMPNLLTGDESSFPKPKSRAATLVAYKATADLAAKMSLFVITVAAARRLTPSEFGVFSLGSTLGWMAAVAADFGMQLHLARAVARAPDAAARLLATWLRIRLYTASAAVAAVVAGVGLARSSADAAAPIVVLGLVYAASGLVEFLHYFYRGLSRSDIESWLTMWQRAATLVCGLAALAWRPSVGTLAVALLLPVLVTLAVSLRLAGRLSSRVAPEPNVGSGFSRTYVGSPNRLRQGFGAQEGGPQVPSGGFLRDVAPIGAGIVLSALYFRVDVFLVQWWAGTEKVALYNAVFRVIEGLRLFPAAALAVALPDLCRARDVRPLATVSTLVTAGGLAVATAAWPFADRLVVLLFGEPYAAAAPAFRILLLSFPLLSLNYALTHQLIGWDRQRAYAAICAAALVVNVTLNARLIPVLSIEGAAWATIGTELVVTVGCTAVLASRSRWLPAHLSIADPRIG